MISPFLPNFLKYITPRIKAISSFLIAVNKKCLEVDRYKLYLSTKIVGYVTYCQPPAIRYKHKAGYRLQAPVIGCGSGCKAAGNEKMQNKLLTRAAVAYRLQHSRWLIVLQQAAVVRELLHDRLVERFDFIAR